MQTFLFTDIADHTALWEANAEAMSVALAECEQLIADAVLQHSGAVVKRDGDAVMAVFDEPAAAVESAAVAQEALAGRAWRGIGELHVRMGLHVGTAEHRDGDYYGSTVIRAARLCACAHGGQVVASAAVTALVPGAIWTDLGEYRLRGLREAERIHQLVVGAPRDFPPLRDAEPTVDRLPHPRTSFVGRADDVAAGVGLLESARIVTLTGVGGSGKTRLAIEIARAGLDQFPDGAVFVDLAPLTDAAQVDPELARMVGLDAAAEAASDLRARLRDYLRRRRALVLLDNCEHLLDDCADLVDDLLEACADLAVLATSREPLRVEGEHVMQVPSLEPDTALELLRERAAVEISDEALARRICERLDGIPLAIELAAARSSHLSLEDLAARLDDRFRLLTGGRRRVQRQQTLQATLDWSFDLLDPGAQALFRRLAVFAGPFTLDAAEAICGTGVTTPIDTLAALVNCSLVTYDPSTRRYRLLETMRLYGENKMLELDEVLALRDAHRDWFAGRIMALPDDEAIIAGRQSAALVPDLDNIRAALRWTDGAGDWEALGQLNARLIGLWFLVDPAEGRDWAERAFPHLGPGDTRFRTLAAILLLGPIARSAAHGRLDPRTESIGPEATKRYTEFIVTAYERADGLGLVALSFAAGSIYAAALATHNDDLRDHAIELRRTAAERATNQALSPVLRGAAHLFAGQYELTATGATTAVAELTLAAELLADTGGAASSNVFGVLAYCLWLEGSPLARDVAERAVNESSTAIGRVGGHGALALVLAPDDVQAAAAELDLAGADLDRSGTLMATEFLVVAAVVAFEAGSPQLAARWRAACAEVGGIWTSPAGAAVYRAWSPRMREALTREEAADLRAEGGAIALEDAVQEARAWALERSERAD